jgi:hypothetical protein
LRRKDSSLELELPEWVWLVGAGDDDPRHLSPLAEHALGTADAVIHDLVNHRHFNAQLLPSVRSLRAEASSATLIVLLQMLGVWGAAWAALASVSSWMR